MINPVGNNLNLLDSQGIDRKTETENNNSVSFSDLLKDSIYKVNDLQVKSEQAAADFALGKIDNIHQVTVAAEKARLALDLTLSIQNKIVDAYKEIMRMQV